MLSPTHQIVIDASPGKRAKAGLAYVEGERAVEEALCSDWPCEALMVLGEAVESGRLDAFLDAAEQRRVRVYVLNAKALEKVSGVPSPPPVGVLLRPPELVLEKLAQLPHRMLVLDRVNDPGNAGTLVRTAAAFGFATVLTAGSVKLINEKFLRSSAGVCFKAEAVFTSGDSSATAALLKQHKVDVYTLEPRAAKTLDSIVPAPDRPLALVLGNEAQGLDAQVWSGFTGVSIPMRGDVESLNVSISGAIALYELARR